MIENTNSVQTRKLNHHIWLIFFFGFLLTALASYYFYQDENKSNRQRLDRVALRIIDGLHNRLKHHQLVLNQAKAFLIFGKENITDKSFQEYLHNTQLMENYPGMQAMAHVVRLTPGMLASHLKERRKETPDYKVWPQNENVELTSISHIAPMNWRNSRAVGFNMMTEPIRRAAMEKARDTGLPALSKMLVLMQENGIDPQLGFILYVPIYGKSIPANVSERREQLAGYVTSPFRARDFTSAVIRQTDSAGVDFKIFYEDEANEKNLIYHHYKNLGKKPIDSDLPDLIKTIAIGENKLKFFIYADSDFIAFRSHYFSLAIALFGLLLTFLIMRVFFITYKQIEIKQTALNIRDEFLSIASHELKTPITSLQLQLQMTRRNINSGNKSIESPEKLIKAMDNSIYQVSRVTRLIDDLLEISKIENGKQIYNFDKTDVGKLLVQVCDSHSDQIDSAGSKLTLNLVDSLVIDCDRFKLEQVFSNLLTNAIKYGAGSAINVNLQETNGFAHISIKDGGPGIPDELQAKIFERFERVTSDKTVSGLGLGLYISKQIVSAHQGRIRVQSEPGKGAEFIVEIPLVRSSGQ